MDNRIMSLVLRVCCGGDRSRSWRGTLVDRELVGRVTFLMNTTEY